MNYYQFSFYYSIVPAFLVVLLILHLEKKKAFKKIIPEFLKTNHSFYSILTFILGLATFLFNFWILRRGIGSGDKGVSNHIIKFFSASGFPYALIFSSVALRHMKEHKLKGKLFVITGLVLAFLTFFLSYLWFPK